MSRRGWFFTRRDHGQWKLAYPSFNTDTNEVAYLQVLLKATSKDEAIIEARETWRGIVKQSNAACAEMRKKYGSPKAPWAEAAFSGFAPPEFPAESQLNPFYGEEPNPCVIYSIPLC